MANVTFSLQEFADALSLSFSGEGDFRVTGIQSLQDATDTEISFLENPSYKEDAEKTKAKAVILRQEHQDLLPEGCIALITDKPYVAFAKGLELFHPRADVVAGISNQAIVSQSAEIDDTARIEPRVVIYQGVKVGAGAHIQAGTVLGEGVEIGAHTLVEPNCVIQNTKIGENCLIHAGVCLGQDGFGFAQDGADIVKVPQVGGVILENHVEIGANAAIDRGALDDTVIGAHTKIDNLVQIGHNVKIGKNCRIVAQVGIAGSTKIGDYSVIGGQSGISGHIEIADKVMVAARSGVTKTIDQAGMVVAGFPAMPMQKWRRMQAMLSRVSRGDKPKKQG